MLDVALKSFFESYPEFKPKNRSLAEIMQLIEYGIKVRENDGLYLLNYYQFAINSPEGEISKYTKIIRETEFFRMCRGMVISEQGGLESFGLSRFFNRGEAEASDITWNKSWVEEKIDGSLINLFYAKNKWWVCTRGMLPAEEDFKTAFLKLFGDKFRYLKTECTYVFELVAPVSRNVTRYSENNLYLITIRDLNTLEEWRTIDVQQEALLGGWKFPYTIPIKNTKDIGKLLENLRDDEEGFVIRDIHNNRLKVKTKAYLEMSRIISLDEVAILKRIATGEGIDKEHLAYFKDVREIYELFEYHFDKLKEDIKTKYLQWYKMYQIKEKHKGQREARKAFAMVATKHPFQDIFFGLLNKNVNKDSIEVALQKTFVDAVYPHQKDDRTRKKTAGSKSLYRKFLNYLPGNIREKFS